MQIFKDIEFDFNKEEFKEEIKIGDNKRLIENLDKLLSDVMPLINPKAIYEVSYVQDKDEETIEIDDIKFESKILSENLADIDRVFPYIVTCGVEIDEYMEDISDFLEQFWLDKLKEKAMRSAQEYLEKYLEEKYKIEQLASMNPGSGDLDLWPIAEQKKLFSIFGDTEELIGVRLTDSYLMLPNKSLSGIYFPADIEYVNCQYCKRENCPNRKAPYNGGH